VIPVAGDSKISWTSIADLGLATALVLADNSGKWIGKTFYLSQKRAVSLSEVAEMVSQAKGKSIKLRIVDREEHEKYYVQERGMDEAYVKWWARTYDSLRDAECEIQDDSLEQILSSHQVKPVEETIQEMFASV
jgi:nucleoside-diphosphate-sugar epimerase